MDLDDESHRVTLQMITGPALCGIAVLCFVLIGPVGPCGPSSPLGIPLLLGGFLSAAAGWMVSLVALLSVARSDSRSELLRPSMAATGVTAVLAGVTAFTMAQGPESSSAAMKTVVGVWPPLAAASVLVARWLRERATRGASERLK